MSTDLVVRSAPLADTLALVEPSFGLIERLCKTNVFPVAYRGKPEESLACVLMGNSIGLDFFQSLQEINMIQGTPALSAKAQRAIVTAAGHDVWMVESSAVKCVMRGRRHDWPADRVTEVVWTIQDAERARLEKKDNWRNHPADMLIARASGRLCRLIASDVLLGLAYNAEEVRDGWREDEESTPVDDDAPSAPAPKSRTRKLADKPKAEPEREKVESVSKPDAAPDPVAEVDEMDGMGPERTATNQGGPPDSTRAEANAAAVADEGPRLAPDRMLAMRCKDAGIPEDLRHAFYFAASSGAHVSGKKMSPVMIANLIEWLGRAIEVGVVPSVEVFADGQVEVMLADELVFESSGFPGATPAAEAPPDVETVERWDEVRWAAERKAHGVSVAALVKEAASRAKKAGIEGVGNLKSIVAQSDEFVLGLQAWVEGS